MPASLRNFGKLNQSGISVIELIVVLTVMAVLTYFAYYYYQGISKRAHDATRIADMANLRQAIDLTLHESEPGTRIAFLLCNSVKIPCNGISFPYSTENNRIDGNGWVKIDFKSQNLAHFNFLPVDPINNAEFHYEYFADGLSWKLTSKLESDQYKNKMADDGGEDPSKYEIIVKVDQAKIRRSQL